MNLLRPSLVVAACVLLAGASATDAAEQYTPRQLCTLWAETYSFPSGIAQERCRTDFPELAIDYGAYCSSLKAAGEADELTLAACLSYKDARRPG